MSPRLPHRIAPLAAGLALAGGLALAPPPCGARQDFRPTRDPVGADGLGGFETPVNQFVRPTGKQVELPGLRPLALALSPDRRLLATSGQTREVIVIDPASGQIAQRVPLPEDDAKSALDKKAQISYTGLVFSPDGSRLYLANANGDIKVFAVQPDHTLKGLASFPLPPVSGASRKEEIPAGLAVSADGARLYVAGNLSNQLLELDAATGRVLRVWPVGCEPYDVALCKTKAYVSNWGGRRPDANSLTGPAGSGTVVRVDPIRHVPNEGSVSVIDLNSGAVKAEIQAGIHASGLAVSPNQRYVVAANAGSDTLSVIDTRADAVVETICARQNPGDLFGAQPNALAFDKSGGTLFVCNGTQNAVAVFKFDPGESTLRGLVPVGWFPSAIVYDVKHKTVAVANLKGDQENAGRFNGRKALNSAQWHGSLSLVQWPTRRKLADLTEQALDDIRYPLLAAAALPARPAQAPRAAPERVGEPSLIRHVVYVIKENRTYDQVLGDINEGNGDPALCAFGREITPNFHKLTRDFILLDNIYCCGSRSPDGHQWTDSALANDYIEKLYAGFPRSYPYEGSDVMACSSAGFIWDDALAHGKTFRDYGEFTQGHRSWKGHGHSGAPKFLDMYHELIAGTHDIAIWSTPNIETLRPYMDTNTIGWDLNVPDGFRAAEFIRELKDFEQKGEYPELVVLWLPNDHTDGTKPGLPTPNAMAAGNDLALGQVIEALSHSPFWKDTCVFAIEDDPQSGWDHVSGYRTTAYIASPYARRHQVISTQYNQTSLLRTIELMLGLPPMNQLDATATPMFDCFTDVPDLTPYDAVPNNVPLDQMNPQANNISDPQLRKDAYVSSHLPLEKPDQCPDDVLNHILWHATKGPQTPYPDWAISVKSDD